MRKVLYAALLIPLLFVPLRRVNVADLLPIESVAIYKEGDQVVLETDTQLKGFGENAEKALLALKENTPLVAYLDTAKYLLVAPDAIDQAELLRPYLKSTVKVCVCEAGGRVKEMAKYLEIRGDFVSLKTWKNKLQKSKNTS